LRSSLDRRKMSHVCSYSSGRIIDALYDGCVECIRIYYMQEINKPVNEIQGYPIHVATGSNRIELVRFLVDNNVDIDALNMYFETPIKIAFREGFTEIVQILILRGAKLNIKNFVGKTLLFNACRMNNFEFMEYLLSMGLKPNEKDNEGQTPLFEGCKKECLELMLKYNANINIRDNEGHTPLLYITMFNDSDIIPHYVEHGADINAKDDDGYAPINYALGNRNKVKFELLLSLGADASGITENYEDVIELINKHQIDPKGALS